MSERRDLAVIASLVPAGSRVLDLGCGRGELLAHLVQHKGCNGYGVEIDDANLQASLARGNDHKPGLQNLARLLRAQGREAEALAFETRLAQLERDPPFSHFDRGVAAAKAGQYAVAREHLLREMQRDPDYHEFHFWLAISLYGLGEIEEARSHLSTAMKNSVTTRDQALYASKLKSIGPAVPAGAVPRAQ